MKIGKIKLKNKLLLAPMAGYSDVAMRSLCVKYGVDYGETEMVSAKALIMGSEKTINLLKTANNEKIKVCQLFGSDPQVFANAVKHPSLKKFDIIDLNMGCPANKIIKNNEGSSLMKNLQLASEIIKACVQNTAKPITVKFRLGYEKINAVEFAKMCEQSGANAIIVHGRTAEQGYSGEADYKEIAKVKKAVSIPVVANGDVVDKKSYLKILKETNADAVMIGRGAVGAPWIFAEIYKKHFKTPNKTKVAKQYVKLLKKYNIFNVNEIKKQLLAFFKGGNCAKETKLKIVAIKNEKDIENLFNV